MYRKLSLLAAALLATTSVAWAGPDRDDHRHDRGRHGWHDAGPRHPHADHHDPRYRAGYYRPQPWHDRGHHYGWGPRPVYYHRGDRLPPRYYGGGYYVRDYHHYRLHQPRPGYRWVRSDDGQFLLVAVATGLIVEAMLAN